MNVGQGHETGGEVLCRGDGALHAVGIEVHIVGRRCGVLLEESFTDEPFAEILSHHRLQHAATQCQFAGGRGPLCPLMRCETAQCAAIGRER